MNERAGATECLALTPAPGPLARGESRPWPRRVAGWLAAAHCGLALGACGAPPPAPHRPSPLDARVRRIEAATSPVEQAALAQMRSVRSDRVEVAVAFPDGFDPARSYPILVTQVTADRYRPNVAELSAYVPSALSEGYVALTAQAIPWPSREQRDTLVHRYATLRAALRWLAGEVPQSERWPIVLAGFSGGAKISQALAFSLMLEERRVAGVFLGGCNEAHARVLLEQYPAVGERFSRVAFFVSAGADDRIAPPDSARLVAQQLRSAGARRVEVSQHPGGHRLDAADLKQALRWFRAQL